MGIPFGSKDVESSIGPAALSCASGEKKSCVHFDSSSSYYSEKDKVSSFIIRNFLFSTTYLPDECVPVEVPHRSPEEGEEDEEDEPADDVDEQILRDPTVGVFERHDDSLVFVDEVVAPQVELKERTSGNQSNLMFPSCR